MRTHAAILLLLITVPVAAAETPSAVASPQGLFEFRSDPWINLHHFLYHWSRAHEAREQKLWGRVRLDQVDVSVDLGDQRTAWDAASRDYLEFVDRSLNGGKGMRQIKVTISEGPEHWPDHAPFRQLKKVMPIYLEHWWPRHDRKNRELMDFLQPLLESYEQAVANDVAAGYESRWPDEPIDVRVSYYTNWAGAYTSWGPNLIMMASSRQDMFGPYGLEILFHEAGHTAPLGEKVRPLSLAAAEAAGVDEGEVWHALLFHITGEAVRSALGSGFVPYAENFGLWERDNWKGLHPPIRGAFDAHSGLDDRLNAIHRARAKAGQREWTPEEQAVIDALKKGPMGIESDFDAWAGGYADDWTYWRVGEEDVRLRHEHMALVREFIDAGNRPTSFDLEPVDVIVRAEVALVRLIATEGLQEADGGERVVRYASAAMLVREDGQWKMLATNIVYLD